MPSVSTLPGAPRVFERNGARILVFAEPVSASRYAADSVSTMIKRALAAKGSAVLGLATGSTPIALYAGLVELHRAGALSFANVTTYNLDEYYPMSPLDSNSYRGYMHRHLLGAVDVEPNRSHLLDGTVPESFAAEHAETYERWIAADGGLDFQLLGIGRNGHIGFNEPSDMSIDEARRLRTRLISLHPATIADAAKDFGGEAAVPRRALTMGVGTILDAREIMILAFGANKADAVFRSIEGPITSAVPGSFLQTRAAAGAGAVTWILDEAAAGRLTC